MLNSDLYTYGLYIYVWTMETQLFQPKHKFNFAFDKHTAKTIFADTKKYRYFQKKLIVWGCLELV